MNMDKLQIRPMTPEDAAAVEIVETACFHYPWSREAFWQEAANEQTHYLVLLSDDEIIGYMGAWLIGDEAHITNVAITPAKQQHGLGTRLVSQFLVECLQRGITAATLEVRPSNTAALTLYQKLGFKSVGQRPHYYEDGEAAIIMWITDLPQHLPGLTQYLQ